MDPRDALPHVHRAVHGSDAQCNELANVGGQTSTAASIVNLVQPTTVASEHNERPPLLT